MAAVSCADAPVSSVPLQASPVALSTTDVLTDVSSEATPNGSHTLLDGPEVASPPQLARYAWPPAARAPVLLELGTVPLTTTACVVGVPVQPVLAYRL